ncbi:SEC23-interacting protein [Coccinella septempunctata]|uniref:SEC23-interacting protein n=1 Tax=Coccinella septempunctata TaxID=41139 RepID=UPI001D05E9E5|nr:SEC23-interacting protein [Coccinella septempunctata]
MDNELKAENFLLNGGQNEEVTNQTYQPVKHHWFFKRSLDESKEIWLPFSKKDSAALEEAYVSEKPTPEKIVATDGGRFDVNIELRIKTPVYWKGEPIEVRRCSWFYKSSTSAKYLPYQEHIAANLEIEYKSCFDNKKWHKRIELPSRDTIVLHSHDVIVLFPPSIPTDDWNQTPTQERPRVVRRGVEGFDIEEGELEKVDHLLFMVHGIGSVCDLKFRTVYEVVDVFRSTSLQLLRSHYQSSCEKGTANRLEVLPISWHDELHSEDTGVDKRLKSITLDSMSTLREFTNDTLLDILFYTSPLYCQKIISTVGNELNRLFELFKKRNPSFKGRVSLCGHSLGSLILFDLLSHQQSPEKDSKEACNAGQSIKPDRRISHMYGATGAGITRIHYPQLTFQPKALFAMGSPIGMFVTVRGLDSLGEDFALPNCESFFNIFHPYDPVAYRIESLINPKLASVKPMLIPHHKGRKRIHLELKETLSRVGADLKQRVVDSVKHTWNSLFQMGVVPAYGPALEEDTRVIEEEEVEETSKNIEPEPPLTESVGILNKGRRVDYVLQESPFELFSEYISSLRSHVCYWESEDTMLFILKEIYSTMEVKPDSQIPQATMTIERPLDAGSRRGSAVITTPPVSSQIEQNVNGTT